MSIDFHMPPRKPILFLLFFLFNAFVGIAQSELVKTQLTQLNLKGLYTDYSPTATHRFIKKWQYLNEHNHSSIYDSLPAHIWQEIFEQRYKKTIQDKDNALRLKIAIPLAYVLHVQSKFDKGILVLEYLYAHKNEFDNKMIGTILIKLEEEYRSLGNMSKVIQIREERIEKGYINTFWEIYYSCGLYREAIEDFKLFEPIPPIATRERMNYFSRIGDMFFDAQQFDSAEHYNRIGIKEAQLYQEQAKKYPSKDKGNLPYWEGVFKGMVARCMMERGQYKQALPFIQFQLGVSKDSYRQKGIITMSEYLVHTGQIIAAKKYLDSTRYYLQDKTVAKAYVEYYKTLSEYYQTAHQFDSSLFYLKKHNELKEQLINVALKNQAILLLGKLELGKRRKDLANTQIELNHSIEKTSQQKYQLYFSIAGLIVFAIITMLLSILFRQKYKANKEIEVKNLLLEQYAQANLNKSKHNEQLIKELHHRVKNNLQNIYSLLNIQKRRIIDGDSIEFIQSIQNRINSMAIVH